MVSKSRERSEPRSVHVTHFCQLHRISCARNQVNGSLHDHDTRAWAGVYSLYMMLDGSKMRTSLCPYLIAFDLARSHFGALDNAFKKILHLHV